MRRQAIGGRQVVGEAMCGGPEAVGGGGHEGAGPMVGCGLGGLAEAVEGGHCSRQRGGGPLAAEAVGWAGSGEGCAVCIRLGQGWRPGEGR